MTAGSSLAMPVICKVGYFNANSYTLSPISHPISSTCSPWAGITNGGRVPPIKSLNCLYTCCSIQYFLNLAWSCKNQALSYLHRVLACINLVTSYANLVLSCLSVAKHLVSIELDPPYLLRMTLRRII